MNYFKIKFLYEKVVYDTYTFSFFETKNEKENVIKNFLKTFQNVEIVSVKKIPNTKKSEYKTWKKTKKKKKESSKKTT